ncbi:O-antigen ligase [Janthinobacterium sp. CG_23.3]|uniref:O-antigen ligase family protein n=1 Tax=Janthinobacterium sp. CG_23.3 TaxID=3349634 RepID=UPI0038D3ACD9
MEKRNRRGFAHYATLGLLGLGALGLTLLAGFMAAVMAPGALVKMFAVPIGLLGLLGLWVMPMRREAPDSLLNTLLLALAALINLWPAYIVYRFGGLPTVSPTKLAWLALLLLATFSILSCQGPMARLLTRCRAHPVLVSATLFLFAWRVVSSAAGSQPVAQVLSLGAEVVSYYLVFFIALAVLRDERDVFRLLITLVLVAIAQACLASYESVLKHTLFERFITLSGEDPLVLLDMLRQKFRDGNYRAQGTFEHPMVLAEFLAMMVPLAAALFFTRKEVLLRWASLGFIPLAVAMILASRSRSGIAVLVLAVLLVGLLKLLPRQTGGNEHKASLALLTSALLLPVLLTLGYYAMHEVSALIAGRTGNEVSSTLGRIVAMERGVPLVLNSPFFGYGNGMGAVKLGFFDGVRYNIDNYWLGVALDAGLPGLLAYGVVFLGAIFLGLGVYRRRLDRGGTLAGFITISLMMVIGTKTVLSIASGMTLAFILIAAIIVLGEPTEDLRRKQQDEPDSVVK